MRRELARIAFLCALALAYGVGGSKAALAAVKSGQRAEDFELKDAAGRPTRLSALRGKVVLVDLWASWCDPCKKELPHLAELAARLRGRGVEVLAINVDKDRRNADAFLRAHDLHLRVLYDPEATVPVRYEPAKMPTSFVIDRGGMVRYVNGGFTPGDEKKIERQLVELAGP
jgi:thiol-disulfide isomerase/thioredoxin